MVLLLLYPKLDDLVGDVKEAVENFPVLYRPEGFYITSL